MTFSCWAEHPNCEVTTTTGDSVNRLEISTFSIFTPACSELALRYCFPFHNAPPTSIATEAGLEAVEALQSAIDYVNNDLKVGTLKAEQKEYMIDALQTTRDQLFVYVKYMPQGKLEEARLRIERENVDNRDEFDGPSDAGVYNPVKLPWK